MKKKVAKKKALSLKKNLKKKTLKKKVHATKKRAAKKLTKRKSTTTRKPSPKKKTVKRKSSTSRKSSPKKKTIKRKSATSRKPSPKKKTVKKKSPTLRRPSPPKKIEKKRAPTLQKPLPKQKVKAMPKRLRLSKRYMNPKQLEYFREILLLRRNELISEADRTVDYIQNDSNTYADTIDQATQEEEFTLQLKERDRERKLIQKIDEALIKIDNHEYGYCSSCGAEIGINRLEARPTTDQCIDCKELDEFKERH